MSVPTQNRYVPGVVNTRSFVSRPNTQAPAVSVRGTRSSAVILAKESGGINDFRCPRSRSPSP